MEIRPSNSAKRCVTAVFLLISIQMKFLAEFLTIWQFARPAITTSLRATMGSVSIPSLCATSRPTDGKVVLTSPTFISTNVVSILLTFLRCASPIALTLKHTADLRCRYFVWQVYVQYFLPWVSFSFAISVLWYELLLWYLIFREIELFFRSI